MAADNGYTEKTVLDAQTRQGLVGNKTGRMGQIKDEVIARIDFDLGFEENIDAIMKALDGPFKNGALAKIVNHFSGGDDKASGPAVETPLANSINEGLASGAMTPKVALDELRV